MLATIVGGQIAAGLLLRGAWDLWAQSLVLLTGLAGGSLGVGVGVLGGRLRLPARGLSAWVLSLAVLSIVSAKLSPVPVYSLASWSAAAMGLCLIPMATLLSAEGRLRIDRFLQVVAWVLVVAAVQQRWGGVERPPSFLLNQNAFAGAILLLLPVAARRGNWALAAGLIVCLWWSRSVGAWLGLSAALLIHRRAVGPAAFWAGAAIGVIGLIAAYAKLHSPEILHRWQWWAAAWRMAAGAPWLGLGPGSFAYALPAYIIDNPELRTLYAHQYFLETAAERGWPFLVVWVGGMSVLLRRARSADRFGPVAALAHGCVDYPLSVPGVFWLFCLSVALSQPESEEAVSVRGEYKLPILVLIAILAFPLAAWALDGWRADRLRASALAKSYSTGLEVDIEKELSVSEELRPHPEAARLRAELMLARKDLDPALINRAVFHLERAVSMDPYRLSSWRMLEDVYARMGRTADAVDAEERGGRVRPAREERPP